MRARSELQLQAVKQEWRNGHTIKTLVLKGVGVTVQIELDDPRTADTLMKRLGRPWRMVLEMDEGKQP